MNLIPPEILLEIIKLLAYFIVALLSLGLSVFVYFHKSLMRRLDSIENDLRPLVTSSALLKQNLNNSDLRLSNLEERVSNLEGHAR